MVTKLTKNHDYYIKNLGRQYILSLGGSLYEKVLQISIIVALVFTIT